MEITNSSKQTVAKKQKKYIVKVVVLGDVNVGKSNLIRRLIGEEFQELEATVGVEFAFIDIADVDLDDPNVVLSIQVWDTSGAEKYRAITNSHIRNADGAFLIYDITSHNSFEALEYWYESVKRVAAEDIVIYLIGNKVDLVQGDGSAHRKVSQKKAKELTEQYGLQGRAECSAKDNTNIRQTFVKFYKDIYKNQKRVLEHKTKERRKVLEAKREDPKFSCC